MKVIQDPEMLSAALMEISDCISKEWSAVTESHAFCMGYMDALGSCLKAQKKLAFYVVNAASFKANEGDLLVGFGVRESAVNLLTDIKVKLMGGREETVAEGRLTRGSRRILDCPLPLIGMQAYTTRRLVAIDTPDPRAVFVILAVTIDSDLRGALARGRYVCGPFAFNGEGYLSRDPSVRTADSVRMAPLAITRPTFGGCSFSSDSEIDQVKRDEVIEYLRLC